MVDIHLAASWLDKYIHHLPLLLWRIIIVNELPYYDYCSLGYLQGIGVEFYYTIMHAFFEVVHLEIHHQVRDLSKEDALRLMSFLQFIQEEIREL